MKLQLKISKHKTKSNFEKYWFSLRCYKHKQPFSFYISHYYDFLWWDDEKKMTWGCLRYYMRILHLRNIITEKVRGL